MAKKIHYYQKENGVVPVTQWLEELDVTIRHRIYARFDRLELGHYGDYKSVGGGVCELRFAFGSGYRIYFAEVDEIDILFLYGGDKSSQANDIKKAKEYWEDFNGRFLIDVEKTENCE